VNVLMWVTAACAVVWIYLTFGHGMFWSTETRLPSSAPPRTWPSVGIVVPARDEEAVLGTTLPTLLAQDYPGPAGVVLVDDNSTDRTAEIAARVAERPGLPLLVSRPSEPPEGWAGKMWALKHGVETAGEVDYYLFTDADIAHAPGSLHALVASAGDRDMVSQMARLRTSTRWEKLVIPAFVYFFAQLYPFARIARRGSRTAAAAGGCTLIRADALARVGGVAAIHDATIDDVALARAVKRSGGRIWLGLADHARSVRPYPVLADLWHMIARSAYTQLRFSPALLVGTLLGLAFVYFVPPAALVAGIAAGDLRTAGEAVVAWGLMTLTYLPMIRYYRLGAVWAFLLPVAALLYLLMTADSARRHHRGTGASWKGRTYAPGAR
jgi:hopene-associated glycosyltransferase HpnB